jgi:hypothetical protein
VILKLSRRDVQKAHFYFEIVLDGDPYSQDFFYFVRKNKEKIKSEVKILGEVETRALGPYRKEAVEIGAAKIVTADGKKKYEVVDESKITALNEKYKAQLDEFKLFNEGVIEIDAHVWSKPITEKVLPRIQDELMTMGFIVEPPEEVKK